MEANALIYAFWACSSGVILAAAFVATTALKSRDKYIKDILSLLEGTGVGEGGLLAQAEDLCREYQERTKAGGIALYLSSGSGPKKLLQSGESAEVTGPGVVRDLLLQAINTDEPGEAVQGGRFLLSYPIPSQDGAALLLFWEKEHRPDEKERNLLQVTCRLLSLVVAGLRAETTQNELQAEVLDLRSKARAEVSEMEAEMGEEHHLASVGRLAAGVAHELNTPLGAVLTMVSSLLRKEEDPNKKKRLSIVNDAVVKCRDIINKLLVYSRSPVQTEKGLTFSRFVRTDTDLNSIVSGVAEMMEEELSSHGISLKCQLDDNLPAFRANGTQWSHVITNLIANARDILLETQTPNPVIKVTTKTSGTKIKASVEDNGPGVPEAHRGKIFEPFFTTKEVGRGTGLGLAICSEIVRKHKGEIAIKTGSKGGALFEITLEPDLTPPEIPAAPLPKEQYP